MTYFANDLTGMRFGMLTVLQRVPHVKADGELSPKSYWLCKCDCGNETVVEGNNLKKGYIKSCGCNRNKTHGGSRTRLYQTWRNMKTRCENPNNRGYAAYGGRGIKVCAEWDSNFAKFREWAFANGYTEELSIDRIDNNKGYCPENCRWVTREFNTKHQRHNIKIQYKNKVFESIADFSKYVGISAGLVGSWVRSGCLEDKTIAKVVRDEDFQEFSPLVLADNHRRDMKHFTRSSNNCTLDCFCDTLAGVSE